MEPIISRVINASITRVGDNKERVVNLRLADAVECYRKADKDAPAVLSKEKNVSIKYTKLLHDMAEVAPSLLDMQLSDDEFEDVLTLGTIALDVENYAAGSKYTDEDGVEQTHAGAGSDKTIAQFKPVNGRIDEINAARKARKEQANKVAGSIAAFQAAGIDVTKMTFVL